MAAEAGPNAYFDELLRWMRQLEAASPADLGPEWQKRGPRIAAVRINIAADPRLVVNVAKAMCAAASKLLLHLAATKQRCSSNNSSSRDDAAVTVAAQLVPFLLTGQDHLLFATPEGAQKMYAATGALLLLPQTCTAPACCLQLFCWLSGCSLNWWMCTADMFRRSHSGCVRAHMWHMPNQLYKARGPVAYVSCTSAPHDA